MCIYAINFYLMFCFIHLTDYWIDGKDKAVINRFELNTDCSPFTDLSKLAADIPNNLQLDSKSCLALVKGPNAAASKIQNFDCGLKARVLCGYPLDGCTGPVFPSTTAEYPPTWIP